MGTMLVHVITLPLFTDRGSKWKGSNCFECQNVGELIKPLTYWGEYLEAEVTSYLYYGIASCHPPPPPPHCSWDDPSILCHITP